MKNQIIRLMNACRMGISMWRYPQYFTPGYIEFTKSQADFLKTAAESNRPMSAHLALVNLHTKEKDVILTVWASVGSGTPVERCRQLAEEVESLKKEIEALKAITPTTN